MTNYVRKGRYIVPAAGRGAFGDASRGVEVRPGRNGPVYALKPGLPGEPDPRASLIAELEQQKRARPGR